MVPNYDAWRTWTPDQDESDWEVALKQAQALWDSGKCPICEAPLHRFTHEGEQFVGCSGTCNGWAPFDSPEFVVELAAGKTLKEWKAEGAMEGCLL